MPPAPPTPGNGGNDISLWRVDLFDGGVDTGAVIDGVAASSDLVFLTALELVSAAAVAAVEAELKIGGSISMAVGSDGC